MTTQIICGGQTNGIQPIFNAATYGCCVGGQPYDLFQRFCCFDDTHDVYQGYCGSNIKLLLLFFFSIYFNNTSVLILFSMGCECERQDLLYLCASFSKPDSSSHKTNCTTHSCSQFFRRNQRNNSETP